MLIFAAMKSILLILFFFLSLRAGEGVSDVITKAEFQESSEVSSVYGIVSGEEHGHMLPRPLCLSGGALNCSVTFRPSGSSHGGNYHARYSSRISRDGKLSGINCRRMSLTSAALAESERLSSGRYLFSICRLRL